MFSAMKASFLVIFQYSAVILPLAFTSCGVMKTAKEKTTGGMSAIADASWGKFTKPKVPVVQVRSKDMKELPSGQQQAVAFDAKKKRTFWALFRGPVDFKEPTLPANAGGPEGSLLPPIE